MNEISLEKPKRPAPIAVMCIVGFIASLLGLPFVFSDLGWGVGAWYPPYVAITTLIGFACFFGMWMMKKWGMYGYVGLTAVNQIVFLISGNWNLMVLAVPAIVIFFAYKHLPDME